jgi:hypothetical protein
MMEAARTSETSVDNYFTRQYIPEYKSELHTRRRENLEISQTEILFYCAVNLTNVCADSRYKLCSKPALQRCVRSGAVRYVLTSSAGRSIRYLLENVQIRGDGLDRRPETRTARSKHGTRSELQPPPPAERAHSY